MTLEHLTENLRVAPDQAGRLQALRAFIASRASQPKPPNCEMTNSEFYAEIDALEGRKRTSLTQLRHRNLERIDRIAKRTHYDREGYQEYLVENYDRLFGALCGSKAKGVPSDQFRKWWMVRLRIAGHISRSGT